MSADSNPFAKGAPLWREKGWEGTLLLPHGKKSPPPVGFTGNDGMWPDDAQVQAWMSVGGNLGVRLPQTVVGIDVDWYKDDGAAFKMLQGECGLLPPTWKSSARFGLPHSGVYLFRIPWQLKLHDKPLPGIEIIQFHHRYICTWPSIHPEGEKYLLTGPDRMPGMPPPLVDELPMLPEEWLKRLVEVERPVGVAKPRAATGAWSNAVNRLFAETMAGLGSAGGRHDSMRHGVDGLTRLAYQGHPGAQEAIEMLSVYFVNAIQIPDAGGNTRSAAEAHSELQRILDGARTIVESTPSYRDSYDSLRGPGRAIPGVTPWTPDSLDIPVYDQLAGWEYADAKDLIDGGLEPVVAEILPRSDGASLLYVGKVNTIFGASGSGKTWLGLVAIAQEVAQRHLCLYLDWEDDPRTFYRRLINLGCDPEWLVTYAHYISPLLPANGAVVDHLASKAYRLVVMDSTGEAIAAQGGLNQNDDGDVATWMAMLPRPMARAGACVLLVDHMPKAVPEGGTRQEIGSQRKKAAVSGGSYEVIQTEPFSKNQVGKMIVRTGKDRGGNWAMGSTVAECRIVPIGAEGDLRITIEVPRWIGDDGGPIRLTGLMERISRYLEAHPKSTVGVIRVEVRGRMANITQALATLVDEGWVSVEVIGQRQEHVVERPYRESDDPLLRGPDELE